MARISQFLQARDGCLEHYCPGCCMLHALPICENHETASDKWEWDGNLIAPTLYPAVLLHQIFKSKTLWLCHYSLREGMISYEPDCMHKLKGMIVMLPAIPDMWREKCIIV